MSGRPLGLQPPPSPKFHRVAPPAPDVATPRALAGLRRLPHRCRTQRDALGGYASPFPIPPPCLGPGGDPNARALATRRGPERDVTQDAIAQLITGDDSARVDGARA